MNSETDWYAYLREKYREGGPLLALLAVSDPEGLREPVAGGHEQDRRTIDGLTRAQIVRYGHKHLYRKLADVG